MPLSNKAQYILQNISRPAAVHGIFMKGPRQPVFSAVFMVNTPKCSRACQLLHQATILDRRSLPPEYTRLMLRCLEVVRRAPSCVI